MQKIGQPCNVEGIEKINLEEETVADMVSVKRYPLNDGDMGDERGLSIVGVAMIADSQGMVD